MNVAPTAPPALRSGSSAAPLVSTRFDPRGGWAAADGPRRAFAAAGAAALVLWAGVSFVAVTDDVTGWLLVVSAVAAVPALYSLARVFRPHSAVANLSDVARHWVAAVGAAGGIPTLLTIAWEYLLHSPSSGAGDSVLVVFLLLGLPAALSAAVSLPWALVSVVVRLVRRSR